MNVNSENLRFIMGFKLKQFRQESGLSLKELAEKTNLSISYLSEIEKGKKYPKPEKILHLAEALGISFDELVSLQVNKDFDPLPVVFSSPVLKEFPFRMYGVQPQDLLALITGDPEKSGALIRTFLEIGQDYDMRVEHLLLAALRSFQQMHHNYFEDIENAASAFILENGWQPAPPLDPVMLRQYLVEQKGYQIDEHTLSKYPELREIRAVWVGGRPPQLLIRKGLLPGQLAFIFGREIGFDYLKLKERPQTASHIQVSFEQLLNNFKASYFSAALLMNRKLLGDDLAEFLQNTRWDGPAFVDLIRKYGVTPEMFLYRLTELMPHFFHLNELTFFRFQHDLSSGKFELAKIFNMSKIFIPNGMGAREHHCRRWMSLKLLRQLAETPGSAPLPRIASQRLHLLNMDTELFSISLAYPSPLFAGRHISTTICFVMNEAFRRAVKFWDDPAVPRVDVNETCERCGLLPAQCAERVVAPVLYQRQQELKKQEETLSRLLKERKG